MRRNRHRRRPPARQTEITSNSSEGVQFLQQLDGFAHHVATAACPSGGTTGLYAVDATVAFVDHILRPDVFVVEGSFLQGVDDGGNQKARQGKGDVGALGSQPICKTLRPRSGQGYRDIAAVVDLRKMPPFCQ